MTGHEFHDAVFGERDDKPYSEAMFIGAILASPILLGIGAFIGWWWAQ